MMRRSHRGLGRALALASFAHLLIAGCAPAGSAAPSGGGAAPPTAGALAARAGDLTDPDGTTMVYLYHDLAHVPAPVDDWVEEDSRVKLAAPIDKAARRTAVRAEIAGGLAAVQKIGVLHLSLNANLSDYDPSYGEFTVRAFAPSSILSFSGFGEKVSLKFDNARAAQTWKVPAADAQDVRDQIGISGNIVADATLRIIAVQPESGGGSITVRIIEYKLRDERGGQALTRIQPSSHP
jgi:hypothetical protein